MGIIKTSIIALALGLTGGAVSAFLVFFAFSSRAKSLIVPDSTSVREIIRVTTSSELAVSEASQSLVNFYQPREKDRVISKADSAALGFALTNDGLIATTADFKSVKGVIAASYDRVPFPVAFAKSKNGKTFFDDDSGLTFLKPEGTTQRPNLKPITLSKGEDLKLGDEVFAFREDGTFSVHLIVALGEFDASEFPASSERMPTFFRVSGEPSDGTLIFNASGQLMGIVRGKGDIIPAEMIGNLLRDYLKDGEHIKTKLGVSYLNLSQMIPVKNDLPTTGLLLQGSSGRPAVSSKSPAEGVLKVGDVLTSFEGRPLNGIIPLPILLQRYRPGTEVEIGVLRGSKEEKLKIVLGRN